jgi:hypothetical protein
MLSARTYLRSAPMNTALGGQLTVRSSERAGTRFTIFIPVHVHNLDDDSNDCSAADEGRDSGGGGSSGDDDNLPLSPSPTPVNTPVSTPPLSRPSSENCLDDAARQAHADHCFGADDGISGFFPAGAPRSESLQQLKDKGKLPELLDLVRGACLIRHRSRAATSSSSSCRCLLVRGLLLTD